MSVRCVSKMETGAQEEVDEIIVLIEAEAEEEGMDIFDLLVGIEALNEAFLDLRRGCRWR